MNTEMHNKKIAAVYWPDTESESGRCLKAGYGLDLYLSITFHGDHDEIWIVRVEDGVETARHNPRYAESIEWLRS